MVRPPFIRIPRLRRRRHGARAHRAPVGSPPGTLAAAPDAHDSIVRLFAWSPGGELVVEPDVDVERVRELRTEHAVLWLRVVGLGDLDDLRQVADEFGIHPLALEDVLNPEQRPKLEIWPGHLFIVMRAFRPTPLDEPLESQQLSIFLGHDVLITFEEYESGVFDPLLARLEHPESRTRTLGAAYLAYAVLDTTLDYYFPALEPRIGRLEELEHELLVEGGPDVDFIRIVHPIKSDLLALRRAVWPLGEVAAQLLRDVTWFDETMRPYLRDWADHVARLLDGVDGGRDASDSLVDMFMSLTQHRMNHVIKVLTMISTVFIPLSFLVGLWGMNFDPRVSPWNMPELEWAYGYPMALGVMFATVLLLVVLFWRWGWLGRRRPRP